MIQPDTIAALISAVRLCDHVLREFPEEFQPDRWAFVRATLLEATTAAIRRVDDEVTRPEDIWG